MNEILGRSEAAPLESRLFHHLHSSVAHAMGIHGLVCPESTRYLPYYDTHEDSFEEVWQYFYQGALALSLKSEEEAYKNPLFVQSAERGMPTLRVNAPSWYRNEGFLRFINSPGVATWHRSGDEANEFSDVMFTFDCGEGSDYGAPTDERPGIPAEIWALVHHLVVQEFGIARDCLVWVSNLGDVYEEEQQSQEANAAQS